MKTTPLPAAPRGDDPGPYRFGGRVLFGLVAGLALIAGVGGWAATARLSGAVIANGAVVVDGNLKTVQHRDGGIVSEIAVREGDTVREGQILLRLDDAATRAELTIVRTQILELGARRARLIAERDGHEAPAFPAALLQAGAEIAVTMEGERNLFRGNRLHREAQKEQLRLGIEQIEDEIAGLKAQRDSKHEEIVLVGAEQARIRQLAEQNLIETARVYAIGRDVARLAGERGEIDAAIARARTRINEINIQIMAIDDFARTEAQRELSHVEARLGELVERGHVLEDRLSRTDLRTPSDGVVNEIMVHTIGGVISAAEVVVSIVPVDAALRIEARIPPASIDQVRVGQEARLRFSAFNHRTTPEIPGTVRHVSAATTRESGAAEAYYIATLDLTDAGRDMLGDLALLPGMPVEVFVTTDDRTALEYLVRPVTDQFARAFRER